MLRTERREPRVLHVTTSGEFGGAERLLIDVLAHQPPGSSSVCTLQPDGAFSASLRSMGVPCYSLGMRRGLEAPLAIPRLARFIARGRYDIIHTHLVHASAIGLAAARLAGVPSVMTRHYSMAVRWYGGPIERLADRMSNSLARQIFAISAAVRDQLIIEGVDPGRVDLAPNGIDADRVRRMAGTHETTSGGAPTIVHVGSLQERKGQRYLIEAAAMLRADGVTVNVIMVGDGPLRDELARLITSLGIDDLVDLVGHVDNPYPLIARADVYVQPSLEEGFGIAVLEAMALERAVVATTAGGLPEVVWTDETGILVPPGDANAIAIALRAMLADDERRRLMGQNGRRRVEQAFPASLPASRYRSVYRNLADR